MHAALPPGGLPAPQARGSLGDRHDTVDDRRSNPSTEERRRAPGRSAAAELVLVLAATLLPVTTVRAADPEVPPAVDPGTPDALVDEAQQMIAQLS